MIRPSNKQEQELRKYAKATDLKRFLYISAAYFCINEQTSDNESINQFQSEYFRNVLN
ncbi:MAG TPA: hypothetical protein PK404_01525 [Fervidobacterium sp.]|nr:hypothetical protein [Fervidobacterium sp.]HQE48022.1 hypothetical protein [Fervidobacterium sp.]